MESYFSSSRRIKLAVLLLDSRRIPNDDDIDMINYFIHYDVPFAVVITKIDKLNVKEYQEQISLIKDFLAGSRCTDIFAYSSLDNDSIINLREKLTEVIVI